jgi:hypothetical protein
LFPRESLACDAEVSAEGGGFRGITIAHNVREKVEVDAVIAEAVAAGGKLIKAAHRHQLGRALRVFCRSRRTPLGSRLESVFPAVGGWGAYVYRLIFGLSLT